MVGQKVVDLELEIHSKLTDQQIIQYFKDWVNGKPMPSKNPKLIQKLDQAFIPEFAKSLLTKPFLKNFIEFHYNSEVWNQIESILRSKIR